MAQHDYSIANAGGATVRSDINDALAAILSQNSGATAPAVTAPFMPWYDTTAGALKIRNAADTAWLLYSDFALPTDAVTAAKIATDAVTAAKIATGAVAPAKMANGGAEFGIRNRIINGAMAVDQRNAAASQTFTAGAALAYCVDRWYAFCTGANITGQQIAVSGVNRYRFTGAASNTGVGFAQRIEARNSRDMAGSTATLSVRLSSSSLTSVGWAAYYANTADSFGTLASPTRTLIASGTFTISATESTYSAGISIPSAATTGIELVLTGGALLGSQTLIIGDAQLERGSVATPFDFRPFGAELALCQRYYAGPEFLQAIVYQQAGLLCRLPFSLAQQMRIAPALTITFQSMDNGSALAIGAALNGHHGTLQWTTTATGSTGCVLNYVASAEL